MVKLLLECLAEDLLGIDLVLANKQRSKHIIEVKNTMFMVLSCYSDTYTFVTIRSI